MFARDYPEQRPFHGWFLQSQSLEAAATATGPVIDLHRGVGPSDADVAGSDNVVIRTGVLIGERILLAIAETGGVITSAMDIEIFGGVEEGNLVQLTDVGTVAVSANALFDFAFGWPWLRIDIENTDGANAATFNLALHIIPS